MCGAHYVRPRLVFGGSFEPIHNGRPFVTKIVLVHLGLQKTCTPIGIDPSAVAVNEKLAFPIGTSLGQGDFEMEYL